MEVDGSSHPKKKPFYKIEDPGPASIDIPFKQLHYKIRARYPNIEGQHVSKDFVKPPVWKS
jgi:hypothetical protein